MTSLNRLVAHVIICSGVAMTTLAPNLAAAEATYTPPSWNLFEAEHDVRLANPHGTRGSDNHRQVEAPAAAWERIWAQIVALVDGDADGR